jgi:hypothetical protein
MNEADEYGAAAEEPDGMIMLAEAMDRNTAAIDRQNRVLAAQAEILGHAVRMWGMEHSRANGLNEVRAAEREARRFSKNTDPKVYGGNE